MMSHWSMLSARAGTAPRRGLTVMELVVVLAILATVAALLVPLFPNFFRRANKADDATNMAEITKSLQLYQAQYYGYPNDLDMLTDGTTMPSYLPSTANGAYDQLIIPAPLTANAAAALQKVGITRLQPLATTVSAGNATLNPYPSLSPTTDGIAVASGINVAVLNTPAILAGTKEVNTDLYNIIASDQGDGASHPGTYLVLGVGSRNTAVGRTMVNAPVAMPQGTDMNPAKNYCRYGAIFKVDGNEVALTKRARLVAVVSMEEDELETIDNEVVGYIKVSQGEGGVP
jgi:Tfp pilus assembly protein PilE